MQHCLPVVAHFGSTWCCHFLKFPAPGVATRPKPQPTRMSNLGSCLTAHSRTNRKGAQMKRATTVQERRRKASILGCCINLASEHGMILHDSSLDRLPPPGHRELELLSLQALSSCSPQCPARKCQVHQESI